MGSDLDVGKEPMTDQRGNTTCAQDQTVIGSQDRLARR